MENLSARSSSCQARLSTSWHKPARFISSRMKHGVKLIALPLLMLSLSGCGFSPLYATRDSGAVTQELSATDVYAPESRLGRTLKYGLLDQLSSSGNPPANAPFRVDLFPDFREGNIAIEADADVTQKSVILVVPFRLVDVETRKTLLNSVSRARSSYNRVDSEFANIAAARDAQDRVAQVVIEDIRTQLGIYFDRRLSEGK